MGSGRFGHKVALVTGAGRGMGRAHAMRLASEGADIIMCDIARDFMVTAYPGSTPEDLKETERQVTALGRACVAECVDVRDFQSLQQLVRRGVDELGRLDVVVANAGIVTSGRSWELSEEEFDEVVSVNLKGVWHTAKAAIPVLIDQGTGGVIVMTGSTAGVKGLPYLAHYTAAKHGVVGLVEALAIELGQYGIRVVALHPGSTRTGLSSPSMHQLVQENPGTGSVYDNTLPIERMEPDDLAAAVAFLASEEARFMTGSGLRFDLGNLCR